MLRRTPVSFITLILLTCLGSFSLLGQGVFETKLEALKKDRYLNNASWSVYVQNINTGEVLVNHNGEKSLTPASTIKAITSGTALDILGEDFRFETHLQYSGEIDENGVLQGDVYIKGGGDPSLGFMRHDISTKLETQLVHWVKAIQNQGIKSINGNIIGDATIFETATVSPKWIWEDLGNYYGAGASGLNIHENKYNLIFKSGAKEGDPTEIIKTIPKLEGVKFINEVTTGAPKSGDQAYIYCAPFADLIFVRGTVPPGQTEFYIKGSVPDPAKYASYSLKRKLVDRGVPVSGEETTMRLLNGNADKNATRKTIHTTYSPNLERMVYWGNKKSINLYMEALLKMIGRKKYGHGSTHNGIKAIKAYWRHKGVNINGFFMEDGSGLSPMNSITTQQFTEILSGLYKTDAFPHLLQSMSTLGGATNLKAKSGYITRVRGYVGYSENSCGDPLAFAILVNNFEGSRTNVKYKMINLLLELDKLEAVEK